MEGWLHTVVGRYQAGFRRGRRLAEHIMSIKVLAQQGRAGNVNIFACFIDLQSAYDLVPRDLLFKILEAYDLPSIIIRIIRSVYDSAEFCVRVGAGAASIFNSERGLLQGSVLSPVLFNVFLQAIIDEVTRHLELADITGGVTRVRYDGK